MSREPVDPDPVAPGNDLLAALGGRRGLIDTGVPGAVFVAVYAPVQRLAPALWAAIGVAAVLTGVRLARRETLQHALGGFLGVLVSALVVRQTGHAQDYFLPSILKNLGFLVLTVVSVAVRWPLVGILMGAATGDLSGWRADPRRLRAYTWASWFWAGMFALRLAVQVPLYLGGQTAWLGGAGIVLGYPLFALTLYLCYLVIRQVPHDAGGPGEDADLPVRADSP